MKAEVLTCSFENGHEWTRKPTRGRKPQFCPDHKPAVETKTHAGDTETLTCEIGEHPWTRQSKRGVKPRNCPKHNPIQAPRAVNVRVISSEGDAPVKRGPGRPRIHETPEEAKEAALQKSRERSMRLEGALKENGTHLSQQTPYILYKLANSKPGRNGAPPTTTWDKVAEHSPLVRAQYLNQHEADFKSGQYRYERYGRVVKQDEE